MGKPLPRRAHPAQPLAPRFFLETDAAQKLTPSADHLGDKTRRSNCVLCLSSWGSVPPPKFTKHHMDMVEIYICQAFGRVFPQPKLAKQHVRNARQLRPIGGQV